MAPPTPATVPAPPSMSSKDRIAGKKILRAACGSGTKIPNNCDTTLSTTAAGATKEPKGDFELVQTLKSDLGNMRALVTCSICDQLLYEPWTLSCGHTYCYSCLCNWFVPNKTKKTCPECRTSIKRMPAPAFIIKQLVEIFTRQTSSMPSDESVEQHHTKRLEEMADVDRDKNGSVGLFKGTFPEGRADVRFDEEDHVYRCSECGHEHHGGPVCEQCGAEIDDEAYNEFSDMDGEDLDDLENLEVDLDAEMGLHGHYFDDQSSLDDESEDEEDDGSLQDFVVQDGYYDTNPDNHHDYDLESQAGESVTHPLAIESEDDDSDEGGDISNRRRGRVGAARRPRLARVLDSTSPSAPSIVSVSDSADESEGGTHNDEAAMLRNAGWSPLHHDSDEEHTPTPYEYYGYQGSEDGPEEGDESDTETMVGHDVEEDEDDSSRDQSETPHYDGPTHHMYGAGANAYAYYTRGHNGYESDEEHADDDDSDAGLSGMDHDGDTEMSVSPQGFHRASVLVGRDVEHEYPDGRSASVSTDGGRSAGENLGVVAEIHEIEDNSSDSSIRPPPRRRPRQYHNVRTQEYNPRVSMMFAEHQRSIRRAQDQQSLALDDLDQGVWRVEPASVRARRTISYRVAPPHRHDPLGVSQTPSATRVISSSERAARAPRQYRRS